MTDESAGKQIEIYQGEKGEVVFDIDVEAETIWATQAQIAQLFDVAPQNITYHIKNIYREGELDDGVTNDELHKNSSTSAKNTQVENRTCKEILQVQNEGGRVTRGRV